MSGFVACSLKDLTKAINAFFSSSSSSEPPLPDDLVAIIHAYLDKHYTHDDSDSQRLQEDLLSIYQSSVQDIHAHLAAFLAILRTLKPALLGNGRILQWWDKLSAPVLGNLGQQKRLVVEAREALLVTLVYDEDDADLEDIKMTSDVMAERLLGLWLAKSKSAAEDIDVHSRFVENQIQQILLAYGRKRPKNFMDLLDVSFREKTSRIPSLSLFSEFVRHQPPHLDQILQTRLFDDLLQCLQIDTSTRAISLSITALVMILPHIPASASKYLPALFNIYSRLLFWDRERKKSEGRPITSESDDDSDAAPLPVEGKMTWDKMSYLLESDDDTVPELFFYFTMLYGLYPINFMSYIRKPQRYLRHANFPGADDLDVEPSEIRSRSETFRQVHVLHPNFFTMTIESEIADSNRWMKSAAADVVDECMSLYRAVDGEGIPTRSKGATKSEELLEVPSEPLLDQDDETPIIERNSWRNAQPTAVGIQSDDLIRRRSLSQTSHSIIDSPSIRPVDKTGSPPIRREMLTSPSYNQLQDLVDQQKSSKGGIYQTLTNESVPSLALSNSQDQPVLSAIQVDAYLHSLNGRESLQKARSPSLRPSSAAVDSSLKSAYLYREIELLRNDLNFERYLKQQHLTAIGHLRNKQIKEARGEAEIQNLINSASNLKSKLVDAKALNQQMKKETEKSKTLSRKWETELSAKLRVLREEQKKWNIEHDELNRDLQLAKQRTDKLQSIIIVSESKELGARQKVQSVESNLDEMERLRGEVEKLVLQVRTFEAQEIETIQTKENEEAARRRVALLEMELRAKGQELAKSKQAFEDELTEREEKAGESRDIEGIKQSLIDEATAATNRRMEDMQKVYKHLYKRFEALEDQYAKLLEFKHQQRKNEPEEALLGGEAYGGFDMRTFSSPPRNISDEPSQSAAILGCKHDNSTHHHHDADDHAVRPLLPPSTSMSTSSKNAITDSDGHSLDANGKLKIKPQSETRVFGRGGPQNIGKSKKEKTKDAKDETKKDKKSVGIRGYRGLL